MLQGCSSWRVLECTCSRPSLRASSSPRWSLPAKSQQALWRRAYSSTSNSEDYEDFHDEAQARMLTSRLEKTKKRVIKRGQDFVDKLTIQARAGKGGDGGVAFHREKFIERGPPSGGNGGHGGNVYIKPVSHYSSLSHIKKSMVAHNGQAGTGSWQHGRRGKDLVIEVPYGTVVREIRQAQLHDGHPAAAEEDDGMDELDETWTAWRKRIKMEKASDPEGVKERRSKMFVLYPNLDEEVELLDSKTLDDLEMTMLEDERRMKRAKLNEPPVEIDFGSLPAKSEDTDEMPASADLKKTQADERILLLRGGQGGFGNPYFTVPNSKRAPKIATRGKAGASMRLELELKTLADIGLVGFPNAGKSTLLQALTHSKSTVASYAFTTLSPQIGTLIIYDDATYSTTSSTSPVLETSARVVDPNIGRGRTARPSNKDARQEKLRLTIADCPGLLPRASENIGLGYDFLRHIERSAVLVYVVDLSGKDPAKDLRVLRQELEDYKIGLSSRARIIVANKADKVNGSDLEAVQGMKSKLETLRTTAKEWEAEDGVQRFVIPMSAQQRGNVHLLVDNLVSALDKQV